MRWHYFSSLPSSARTGIKISTKITAKSKYFILAPP
nr:MAG TPA: hypothetical protein [Caudoviricetes sp.]